MAKNTTAAAGGGAYFLGFLGAAIYFTTTASSLGEALLGVLKSLVWPAFLVYEAFQYFV